MSEQPGAETESSIDIAIGTRVRSADYGTGTVVLDLDGRLQVEWDEPLTGTTDHRLLLHDRSYIEQRCDILSPLPGEPLE